MTPKEAAEQLNGNEYRAEGSRALWADMKAAGLVAVFGASDDLAELRGAIDDEVGAFEGTCFYVTREGLLANECDNDSCPYFDRAQKAATPIDTVWAKRGFSWTYDTAIPHEKFIINEDGEPYCEGIVFALADVPA